MRSDAWKAKRALRLVHANHQCEYLYSDGARCQNKDRLNVHHLNYDRLGDELLCDLIVLCRHHHLYVHKDDKK